MSKTASSAVRRVDDLGRIVLPKDIRALLHINCGDALAISCEDGKIILKKYSPIETLLFDLSQDSADVLAQMTDTTVIVCDTAQVIAAAGNEKRRYCGMRISLNLEDAVRGRVKSCGNVVDGDDMIPITCNPVAHTSQITVPIIHNLEAVGAIVMLCSNKDGLSRTLGDTELKLCEAAANIIKKQLDID